MFYENVADELFGSYKSVKVFMSNAFFLKEPVQSNVADFFNIKDLIYWEKYIKRKLRHASIIGYPSLVCAL